MRDRNVIAAGPGVSEIQKLWDRRLSTEVETLHRKIAEHLASREAAGHGHDTEGVKDAS